MISVKFWIAFYFILLDFYHCRNVLEDIQNLSKELEVAFDNLKTLLNSAELSMKISNTNKESLNEDAIKEILTKSKFDTEKLVTKANTIVDNISSTLTQKFKEYSMTPSKTYVIECANDSYIFYYRAKSLRNNNVDDLKNCTAQSLQLEKDPFLDNILTNRQISTVHIPTNVYDAGKDIQVVANWTGNLDETFLVKKNDPQVKWQFFCSNTGFFKIYPGIRWNIQIEDSEKDNSLVDFFDCRSEQWYLEATAYPKKMMIMVDKSGSMKGRRRIIANHTIYEILNTLTENDFFNILLLGRKDIEKFAKEYFFADNNTSGILIQATDKNKKFILDQLVKVFTPDGIAEYDVGLKSSFNVLKSDKLNETDSQFYNYLLMIISDGSPNTYQSLIEKQNSDVGARIFTYLIGQGATEPEMVKSMACKNGGYFVEIATLADVKENVQKYLNVIARKNALMRNAFNVWTGVHQMQMQPTEEILPVNNTYGFTTFSSTSFDITFAPNVSGTTFSDVTASSFNMSFNIQSTSLTKIEIVKDKPINLFVTTSKAIFDESNNAEFQNLGILLGAAGVDIPISEFIKTVPFWKIGVNAYLFGITNNGFVLFHPKFRPQYKKFIKYFYRNVDISELEIESNLIINHTRSDQIVQFNDSFQLRTKMINHSSSDPVLNIGKMSTYEIVDDFKTAFDIERTYFIAGIEKTSYKFGLAVPVDQKIPKYTDKSFSPINMTSFTEWFGTTYENFKEQCSTIFINKNENGILMKNYEFCNMNHYIANLFIKGPMCALIEVLTNATTLEHCTSSENDKYLYLSNLNSEIQMTSEFPGLWSKMESSNVQQIFSMHHFGLIRYHNYETLSYENFIANHSLGVDDPLYQETILTAQHMRDSSLLVAHPLPNEVFKKNIVPSSLIFTVTTPLVSNDVFVGIVGVQAKHSHFQSILSNNSLCSAPSVECFLITESAIILMSNVGTHNNGNMLKDFDCALMESLVLHQIFKEQLLYDFQGLCVNIGKQTDNFSLRLINPFTQLFRLAFWVIGELFFLIQNFSLTSILWSFSFEEDDGICTWKTAYAGSIADIIDPVSSQSEKSPVDIPILSADSSTSKSINNLYDLTTNSKLKVIPMETKSKRQHELDIKNGLNNDIRLCTQNNQGSESEWSGCVKKAVGTLCRQDKTHTTSPSDQHVDKLTSQNSISHCVTACAILHSDYPQVWQDQDDCRQPLKICHKVAQTFTTIYPSSIYNQLSPPTISPVKTYYENHLKIAHDESIPRDGNEETTVSNQIKNELVCPDKCRSKKWYVKPIKNTNLLLVVVTKSNTACTCDCSSSFGKIVELSIVNESIGNPEIAKPSFFKDFVNFTKTENSSYCSDKADRSCQPLRFLIVFSIFLSLFISY